MPRIATAVSAMRITLAAIAAPKFSGPGLAEQPVDRDGSVGRVGPHDEDVAPNSPSEIANANPAATSAARATIGRSTSRHTRAGGAPSVAAASRSRGIDGAQHRRHRCARRTGSRRAPARSGRATDDVAEVERRLVERDEEAEADGHRRHAERQRRATVSRPRRRADGRARTRRSRRRRPRSTVATRREAQRVARSRRPAARTAMLPACSVAERAVEVEAVARRRCANDRSTSTSERARRAATRHHREVAGEQRRARRAVRGRRAVSRRGAQPQRDARRGPRSGRSRRAARRPRPAARARARRRAAGPGAARSGGRSRSRASRTAGRRG